MVTTQSQAKQPAVHPSMQPLVSLFNGYIGTQAIFALEEAGAIELLKEKGTLDIDDAERLKIKPHFLTALCNALCAMGVFERTIFGSYRLTPAGKTTIRQVGFFTWAVGGYGDILRNLHPLASGQKHFERDIFRNGGYVAKGSGQAGENFVRPVILDILQDIPCNILADFGCGSAELLIQACQYYPHLKAVGVERSSQACKLARENVANAHLEDSIEILEANVSDVLQGPESRGLDLLRHADTITCLFMLHDLMQNEIQAQQMLREMKQNFPHALHLIFGDTMKTDSPPSLQQSFFIVGFELVHAFMEQQTWKKEVYERVFDAADLHIHRCIELEIPSTWLYMLRTH